MNIDDIKRLSPEERIKKIQQLETEKRKDIQILHKLLAEALQQLDIKLRKQQIPIPQLGSTDFSNLVSAEEKDMFRSKQFQGQVKEVIRLTIPLDTSKTGTPTVPIRESEDSLEKALANVSTAKSGDSSKDYETVRDQQLPRYSDKELVPVALDHSGTEDYSLAGDMMIKSIVELTELFYQQSNDPTSFGKREISRFYKIKEESESTRIRDAVNQDEDLRKKIGIVEKLINMVQYNI